MSQHVVVLGASPKPARYANQAVERLQAHGHKVYPIHPLNIEIHGLVCYKNLQALPRLAVDTLTLYVGKAGTDKLIDEILALKPRRIIFNPGAENESLLTQAADQGIDVVVACTLVMLNGGQF